MAQVVTPARTCPRDRHPGHLPSNSHCHETKVKEFQEDNPHFTYDLGIDLVSEVSSDQICVRHLPDGSFPGIDSSLREDCGTLGGAANSVTGFDLLVTRDVSTESLSCVCQPFLISNSDSASKLRSINSTRNHHSSSTSARLHRAFWLPTLTAWWFVAILGQMLCLLSMPHAVFGAPLPPSRAFVEDSTQRYLMQYGYLPMSDMEMGNLRTDQELTDAVRKLQMFGHIPVTGIVDNATRELMKRPRCSLPDILPDEDTNRVRRYIKQGSTWDKTHLTWGIISYPVKIDGRMVERELRMATELWSKPSKLRFQQITEKPSSADIVIQFNKGYHGDGYPFDGPGRTLAHAFYPGPGIGGDIHFDADEKWVQHVDSHNGTYEEVSMFLTAGHEIGHALGLYHSQAQNSIMSPYLFSYGPGAYELPSDDVAGIQDLYGVNENYEASSESEAEDLPTPGFPYSPAPSPPSSDVSPSLMPDTCDTSYDAISVIRRGVYIFKGKYFWRIDQRTVSQEPVELSRFWYCLPSNVTHIDAVYERPVQDTIVFFSGRQYFVCRGNDELVESGLLRRLGLPADLERIDAAFVWGHNTRTYFMANTMYWRFDESVKHVELDYPRDMMMWKGVPYGRIDAAFKLNGTTYFFKDKMFYEFDDLRMRVRPRSPLMSAPFWMGCPDNIASPDHTPGPSSSSASHIGSLTRVLLTALLTMLCVRRHVCSNSLNLFLT